MSLTFNLSSFLRDVSLSVCCAGDVMAHSVANEMRELNLNLYHVMYIIRFG